MGLVESLAGAVGAGRVLTRTSDLAVYACDASLYRIVPRAVVRPRDLEQVRSLLAVARRDRVPLTFRAAGTSLSGQAVGPGVVVDVSRDWRALEVLDGGRRVRVGPGVVAGFVNRVLAGHGFKLGPDPASIDACMIGGVVANNSSGMCCGTERNAYRTLESLVFVLPSGTVVDTAARDAGARLRAEEPAIWSGVASLRDRVRADPSLVAKIRTKYALKNTMGYSVNAFLDFDDPLEILWHLLVGSEGTLAFLAEAVFRTIPDLPAKATCLLFFEDVHAACAAIAPLRDTGAVALELMDRASLRSVDGKAGVPAFVASLPATAAALLVEHQAVERASLDPRLPELPLLRRTDLTFDAKEQAAMWAVRKGIIPSVGAVRRRGTTLITEDVVFPVEALAEGVLGLQALFRKHAYDDAVIFGHAKDGNLHFLLAQDMDRAGARQLGAFTDDLADLVVVRHGGALKAEHGTGRNMAPFVEREWGREAYAVMREVKRLVDPEGILNPGVLLNDDPGVHLKDLKSIPPIEEEADACIECGFCEPRCPSRDLTLSPRQRIQLRRERARRLRSEDLAGAAAIDAESEYALLDTCATDGMCATACPVTIDTGALVKRLRAESRSPLALAAAEIAAGRFALVERTLGLALRLPFRDQPGPAGPLPRTHGPADAIYWPSCVTRTLGYDGVALANTVVEVCARAGIRVLIPEGIEGSCCGMPFSSKGFPEAAERLRSGARALLAGSGLPAFTDTSPCAHAMSGDVLDSVAFAHDFVLPRLPVRRRLGAVAVHPVCSIVKQGLVEELRAVVSACSVRAYVPLASGCCGFAGDRGFLVPELTEAATRAEAAEIASFSFDDHVSTSRTCEIGMSRATGRPFRSIWHLLEEVSRD